MKRFRKVEYSTLSRSYGNFLLLRNIFPRSSYAPFAPPFQHGDDFFTPHTSIRTRLNFVSLPRLLWKISQLSRCPLLKIPCSGRNKQLSWLFLEATAARRWHTKICNTPLVRGGWLLGRQALVMFLVRHFVYPANVFPHYPVFLHLWLRRSHLTPLHATKKRIAPCAINSPSASA